MQSNALLYCTFKYDIPLMPKYLHLTLVCTTYDINDQNVMNMLIQKQKGII